MYVNLVGLMVEGCLAEPVSDVSTRHVRNNGNVDIARTIVCVLCKLCDLVRRV